MAENVPLVLCIFTLLAWPIAGIGAARADNRCFLIGGGSAETFFVSENTTVGSVIGALRIAGDPNGRTGDIVLQLDNNETVVSIEANSKNLTLIKALDKEGLAGPSHVTTRITCQRRNEAGDVETSLAVPVNIRVTDANDNAPVFRIGTYHVNLSEAAVAGSVVLQGIQALDADQPGPYSTVQYSILPGPFSDVLGFTSTLEGTLVLKRPVDYETNKQFKIAIRAQDQGQPSLYSDAIVIVDVNDADDQNPVFGQSRYWAHLPQPADKATKLEIRPEPMRAVDQDAGLNASVRYAWNSDGPEYQDFALDPVDGSVALKRRLLDNELVQPVTLVVKAHQVDNPDRYALSTLTISRNWAFQPQLQFLQRRYAVQVLENVAVGTTIMMLAINKPHDPSVKFVVDGESGTERQPFDVDKMGELKLVHPLDFEKFTAHRIVVWLSDGLANDTAVVNVTVLNVNDCDPRFQMPDYEFVVTESLLPVGAIIGRVYATDEDIGDRVALQLNGPESRAFQINEDGQITFAEPAALNSTVVHLTVVARDSGLPPRQASVPVKINLPVDFSMLNGSKITVSNADGSGLLLIILGILLGVLSLIISGLAVYLCQYKKRKTQTGSTGSASTTCTATAVILAQPKIGSSLYGGDTSAPVTATLRRMPINPLARPSCRRIVPIQSPTLVPVQTTPPPPPLPPTPPPRTDASRAPSSCLSSGKKILLNNNNHSAGSGRPSTAAALSTAPMPSVASSQRPITNPPAWPDAASPPKRVKKLSWEDEFNVFF